MKLKELHPIEMTKPTSDTQQLVCACGWKGTLWGTNRQTPDESSCTRTERLLHLLEEMEIAMAIINNTTKG